MRKSIEVPFLVWKFRESLYRLEMPEKVGMTVFYPDFFGRRVVREGGVVRVEVVLIGGEEEDLRFLSKMVGRQADQFKGLLINLINLDNEEPEAIKRIRVMRYEFGRDEE